MWTDTTRTEHARKEQRLPSDLTDREWAVLERRIKNVNHGMFRIPFD